MKTAVVIPSMRGPRCMESFIEIAPPNVDFVVLSQEKLDKKYDRTTEFSDKEIFATSWIFNRFTKRNFGFLYAYKQNYDVIISLDDDCYPVADTYFADHIKTLHNLGNDFFNPLSAYTNIPNEVFERGVRGYPTNLRKFPIVINEGLWLGDLDLPAMTISKILKSSDGKIPPPLSTDSFVVNNFVIPHSQLIAFGGMNASFLREVVPAFPWAYQEAEGYGLARYDDVWAGLFVKIILDKLGKRMSIGFPLVRHDKGKRSIQKDLEYEIKGEKLNNFLWDNIQNLTLEGKDYTSCFLEIADWLIKTTDIPERKFCEKISKSMHEWTNLFDHKF
jgi:hypothetical protein